MGFFKKAKKEEIRCPNCRKPVANGSAFCDSCGLRIAPPPACAKCSRPLAPDTNFCEFCGTPVGASPESHRKGKSSKDRKAKKKTPKKDGDIHPAVPEEAGPEITAMGSAPGGEDETALLLPPVTESGTAFFPCLHRMSKRALAVAGIGILCLILVFAALTGLIHIPAPPFPQFPAIPVSLAPGTLTLGSATPANETSVTEETSASPSLVPGPTQEPPESYRIWLQAERDPITNMVSVIFNGGKGQRAVHEVLVRLTRSDGQVQTRTFRSLVVGEGVALQGTKFDDRLEVIITYNNGDTYRVIDQVFAYKERN